ncbi:unnamed protein product [Danaus chrysippus]|uniref:(African queen) hypothetical protein n=1 Tax=Danaus chrysippus TaxID=151541 RepID=A0A8J2QYK8_9NEOP|nr:unnamed protein product [Danaus chrysippus]
MADNIEEIMKNNDKYEPTAKELLEMLDSADLDEETRQSLRSLLGGDVPQFFGGTGSGTLLAITFAALIFSIICK